MTNTHYIVVPQGSHLSRRFAIRDTRTGFIVEQGFATAWAAEDYITHNGHIGGYPDDPIFDY